MKRIGIIFLIFLLIIFFIGIIDKGGEFINLELGVKYPTLKIFFSQQDESIIRLNEKLGIVGVIIPYILLQIFMTLIFIKAKFKHLIWGIIIFIVLLIALFIILNIAFFYNNKILYWIIISSVLLINYGLFSFYNKKS